MTSILLPGQPVRDSGAPTRDRWPILVFAMNLLQTAAFAALYPNQRLDPDLIAYLTYFRNWLHGDATLHGIAYFTHPKALLVFALGPLGSATLALAITALASAALGTIVYLISRDHFGKTTALIVAAFLLLDPSKAVLTLKSSADLYVALFLFATIYLLDRERLLAAAGCLFLSALVKPVTLPCAASFLVFENAGRRRWVAAGIPLLALPLIAWSNHALLGSVHGTDRFLEEFAALRGGDSVGPDSVFHFALWTQLVKSRFIATAAWGFVGLVLWIGADRRRLLSPLLLVPLLFLIGYFLLGFTSRFMPFFRFFWPLEVWFLIFVISGAVETGARLAESTQPWVRTAVVAIVAVLLADNFIVRQIDYRRDFALPFEQSMRFAADAQHLLRAEARQGQAVLIPLALLPYMMWEFPEAARAHRIETAERVALGQQVVQPEWILYIPRIYASDAAREWLPRLIQTGNYELRAADGDAALLALPGVASNAGSSSQFAARRP
jgi:hypothetical protein